MPDQTNFEPRLADALRRYANRAPADIDALALAAEIASASTTEGRRHPRWWPFGSDDPTQERSRTMFLAMGATAALSIALVGGSLALLVSNDTQDTTPAVTPEITLPPLEVRVSKANTSEDGYALGQPTDVVLDLGMDLDPDVPGRTLRAGDSVRVTLPDEFVSNGLPAAAPSECDVAAGACNTGFLLQGWPDSYFPTTEDHYTVEMEGTHTFVFTATQDLGPSEGAPGIKQIHLMAPGFTNPHVMTEYLVEVAFESGAEGTVEADTGSFVASTRYGLDLTSAFGQPMQGAAHASTIYQQARAGESPASPWDFLMWDSGPDDLTLGLNVDGSATGESMQGWRGHITLEPLRELSGTVVPEGPTILERGVFANEVYELGGWWIEGPEGAVGASVTAEPVEEVVLPINGATIPRLRIHFTAGDLPGRYTFHWGYGEKEKLFVDVVE